MLLENKRGLTPCPPIFFGSSPCMWGTYQKSNGNLAPFPFSPFSYINQLNAVIEGGKIRFRPILMNALTTILALTPMALGLGLGGESWAPMARSVIGDLSSSTILTLFVILVIHTYLSPKRLRKAV